MKLTMLNRPKAWPALMVTAHAASDAPVDLRAVARDVAERPRLGSQPLTVYYRVKNCTRNVSRHGDRIATDVIIEIEPVAVTAGQPDKPSRIWCEAGMQFARSAKK